MEKIEKLEDKSYLIKLNEQLPRLSIILICGIPGVGKTFLSQHIIELLKCKLHEIHYLNFDELFHSQATSVLDKFTIDLTKFKNARNDYFSKFKEITEETMNDNNKHIIILDDNFYFKSMRKPFYKYAKVNSCSYLEIHMKSSIEYAISLNNKRIFPYCIPENVIEKMSENFQWNSFHKKFTYDLNISETFDFKLINLYDMLDKLIENVEIVRNLNKNETQLNKKELKALFLELMEDKLRKKVGEIMKVNKSGVDSKYLSVKKKNFMMCIKSNLYKKISSLNILSGDSEQCMINKIQLIIEKIKDMGFIIENEEQLELQASLVNSLVDEFILYLKNN